jgi:hypothetical protein
VKVEMLIGNERVIGVCARTCTALTQSHTEGGRQRLDWPQVGAVKRKVKSVRERVGTRRKTSG